MTKLYLLQLICVGSQQSLDTCLVLLQAVCALGGDTLTQSAMLLVRSS
jgi:hypothetical protein